MSLNRFSQDGQSTVEYALLLGLLALALLAGVLLFGAGLQNTYDHSASEIRQVDTR